MDHFYKIDYTIELKDSKSGKSYKSNFSIIFKNTSSSLILTIILSCKNRFLDKDTRKTFNTNKLVIVLFICEIVII